MTSLTLAWRYLWSRPLGALLNLLLLSLGLASISFLLLVSSQLHQALEKDLAGIDLVVGAKGSPMQLILCGVFHLDVPPGNIALQDVQELARNPMVAQVIPLSLGDNLQGFRIVGTTPDYAAHYGVPLAQGRAWRAPMEVLLGASVARQLGLQVGSRFAGEHGLEAGGHAHQDQAYTVVGLLQPSGTVLDRLVLTDSASVWALHADAGAAAAREVTLALVQYKTPLAAMQLPRWVNTQTRMQAAAPALEITRLFTMLGLGTTVLRTMAAVLLLTAGLGVFIALWSALRERRADLALLRMLGAPPSKIAALLLGEALWLGLLSALLGVAAGQGLAAWLAWLLQLDNSLLIAGMAWPASLLWVPALACGVSLAAALLPAVGAYRLDVLQLLHAR